MLTFLTPLLILDRHNYYNCRNLHKLQLACPSSKSTQYHNSFSPEPSAAGTHYQVIIFHLIAYVILISNHVINYVIFDYMFNISVYCYFM